LGGSGRGELEEGGVVDFHRDAHIHRVSLEELKKPKDGQVLVDRWWVADGDQVIFWKMGGDLSPQCNRNLAIAKDLQRKLYPEMGVVLVAVAFLGPRRD
jgi:hypothetical protein